MARTVIVGIDLGFTGTGVCYMELSEAEMQSRNIELAKKDQRLKIITAWPGNLHKVEYKVPTVIAHRFDGADLAVKFGFEVTNMPPEVRDRERWTERKYFKLMIDKEYYDPTVEKHENALGGTGLDTQIPSYDKVCKWFQQYLTFLHDWIQRVLGEGIPSAPSAKIPGFSNCEVIYLLSVPTTWDEKTIDQFKMIARAAGFGKRPLDSLEIGRNEAEAAALYTLCERNQWYQTGDFLISCDAGGGTTDVTSIRLKEFVQGNAYRTMQLQLTQRPRPVGSTQIDDKANKWLQAELLKEDYADLSYEDRKTTTRIFEDMFQGVKISTGTSAVDSLPSLFFPVSHKVPNVVRRLELPKEELHGWFDIQIGMIVPFIEKHLADIDKVIVDPEQQLPGLNRTEDPSVYLALTGGLGSSDYVKTALERYFAKRKLGIVRPTYPQLAVCKGLVIDRALEIANGKPMIENIARASYGVLVRRPVPSRTVWKSRPDPSIRRIEKCPVTDRKYYTDNVKWLVKMGDYETKGKTVEKRIFSEMVGKWTEVLIRHDDSDHPRPEYLTFGPDGQITSAGVVELQKMDCEITPSIKDVAARAAKLKPAGLRGILTGKKNTEIEYTIQVRQRGADVLFELIFNNKVHKVLHGETVQIEVRNQDHGEYPDSGILLVE